LIVGIVNSKKVSRFPGTKKPAFQQGFHIHYWLRGARTVDESSYGASFFSHANCIFRHRRRLKLAHRGEPKRWRDGSFIVEASFLQGVFYFFLHFGCKTLIKAPFRG
jgi:hypothetical protein